MSDAATKKTGFVQKVLDYIKNNKKALAIGGGAGLVIGGGTGWGLSSLKNKKKK